MLATVLFAGFIIYLYIPSQIFRFWANTWADLNRRRTASQLEEFLAASIPSSLLNIAAVVTWSAFGWASKALGHDFGYAPVGESVFSFLSALVTPPAQLNAALNGQKSMVLHAFPRVCSYAVLVWGAATIFGAWYGKTEHTLAREGGAETVKGKYPTWGELWSYFLRPPTYQNKLGVNTKLHRRLIAKRVVDKMVWAFRLLFYRVWDRCYAHNKNTIYPWATRNSSIFAKLKSGTVFHGTLQSYSRTQDGEVDGIYLDSIQRFDPDTLRENAAKGLSAFRRLTGTMYIKWEEVLDVNFAPPEKITLVRRQYARHLRIARASKRQAGSETWARRFPWRSRPR